MAVVGETGEPRNSRCGPPLWACVLVYGVGWLPAFFLVVCILPRFVPMLSKLAEQGRLFGVRSRLLSVTMYDLANHHIPVLLVGIALIVFSEGTLRLLRKWRMRSIWPWLWLTAVGSGGIAVQVVIVLTVPEPKYRTMLEQTSGNVVELCWSSEFVVRLCSVDFAEKSAEIHEVATHRAQG